MNEIFVRHESRKQPHLIWKKVKIATWIVRMEWNGRDNAKFWGVSKEYMQDICMSPLHPNLMILPKSVNIKKKILIHKFFCLKLTAILTHEKNYPYFRFKSKIDNYF